MSRSAGLERLDSSAPSRKSESSILGSREIAELKRNVLEASRIRGVEGSVHQRRTGIRLAIAAAVLCVLVVGGTLFRTSGSYRALVGSPVIATEAEMITPTGPGEFFSISGPAVDLSVPTVGSLAPAAARVYDFGQEHFALVMVVDETLDL